MIGRRCGVSVVNYILSLYENVLMKSCTMDNVYATNNNKKAKLFSQEKRNLAMSL